MILCVTPNPALDRTLIVRDFANGGVFRPQECRVDAGGKGLNVARAIKALGGQPMCAGFLGGFSGQSLDSMVREERIPTHWTWLDGRETRTCVILVDPETQLTTVVNEPGPPLVDADWERLRDDLHQAAADASVIAFSGSLPHGSSPEVFASLVADLIRSGKQVWVDTSGTPLTAIARVKGVRIKINDDEAAALVNAPILSPSDALTAARQLHGQTDACVVITLGAQGAVMVDDGGNEAWHAIIPSVTIKSGVGGGDSFLSGLLVALVNDAALSTALGHGAAAGTANALSIGGGRFTRLEFEEILRQILVVPL
jgi:1-phosphofructokinase family hexose kinase